MTDPGTFSLSLNVKNLSASRLFYESVGFHAIDGDGKSWVMVERDGTRIGLFEDMIDRNMLTFQPADARAVASGLVADGYEIEAGSGSGDSTVHFIVHDPDGNPLLFDQSS